METQQVKKNWAIDPVHTRIRFESKYLLITSVSGWFTQFEGTVQAANPDFSDSEIQLTIYTHSVFTGNEERDNHLKSPDFFDAKKYPAIRFTGKAAAPEAGELKVTGILAIKDTSQSLDFLVKHTGTATDPMGNTKAGFAMQAIFNRKDFNINWNQQFDKHGILLSDEVALYCDVQLLRLP